jgi:hypothetical protein
MPQDSLTRDSLLKVGVASSYNSLSRREQERHNFV